jgi:hypothetical protein
MKSLTTLLSALLLAVGSQLSAHAQGTAFTYQGFLTANGAPANGSFDLQFAVFDAASGGAQQGATVQTNAVGITNGLFTVTIDPGANVFTSAARWLNIGVRPAGGASFTNVIPRQPITATPYAIQAASAVSAAGVSGSIAASQLTGTISSNNIATGSITTGMLATGAVGANQLASGAVTTSALADGAVTALKVATATDWSLWNLSTPFTAPTPEFYAIFGYAAAAVGNDRVLIGAYATDLGAPDAGAAYLSSTNGTLLTTFSNPNPTNGAAFGWSVAAVGSDRVLIGAIYDNTGAEDAGAAYLFSTDGTLLTTFTNPTPANADYFGSSVAAVGDDRVLIGAYRDDTGASDAGAAYLFSTNGTLLTTFLKPTPESGDFFGWSVAAVSNNRVLIGAILDNAGDFDAGAAYLFSTNGALLTTFTNPTPAAPDSFGYAVTAVGNDRVLIGAYGDDTSAPNAGAAYLFGTNGTLLTTFAKPTPAGGDNFGWSVATVGNDRILIGANGDDTGATDAGAAYLFSTNGTLLNTFTKPTPAVGDNFGTSVAAVGNDQVLIGAILDDTGAFEAGAAYLFSLSPYAPGLVAEGVRSGAITTTSLASGAVVSSKIADGTIVDADIAANANIADSKLATLSIAGKVADSALSANVTKLGSSIESTEITDGTLVNADISPVAAIADTKLATLSTPGKVADSALSANSALLNRSPQAFTGGTNSFAGRVGVGTTSPGRMLQLGDASVLNSEGMLRFISRSGTGPSARQWDIGVPEGDQDTSGKYYSFVIDDTQNGSDPEFLIRWDTGNVGINQTNPVNKLDVVGGTSGNAIQAIGKSGGSAIYGENLTGGGYGIAGRTSGSGLAVYGDNVNAAGWAGYFNGNVRITGTLNPPSDRNVKRDFATVDTREVLEKLAALSIQTWAYTNDTRGSRHLGPVAQDFKAAFGLGADDTSIATVDADGVALAAIQGLNQKLEAENAELKARLEKLEQFVNQQHNHKAQ